MSINPFNRPFDKTTYDAVDSASKVALENFYVNTINAKVVSGKEEMFKAGDLIMETKTQRKVIEAEMRRWMHFNRIIMNKYDTVNIPFRKSHLNYDVYHVLSPDFEQMFITSSEKMRPFLNNLVSIPCDGYYEKFFQVDKKVFTYWEINSSGIWKNKS